MDILKKIIIAMGILLALLFIGALFLPSRYDYRWTVDIEAPPEKVYATVADFNSWQHWDVWYGRDPQAKFQISGKPGEPGHARSWEGPLMGKGRFHIVGVQRPVEVTILMEVREPNVLHLDQKFIIVPLPQGGSSLTWSVSGELVYPLGRLLGLFFKGFIEPDFLDSLANLKNYLEKT